MWRPPQRSLWHRSSFFSPPCPQLPSWAIALIVLASLVAVAAISLLTFLVMRERRGGWRPWGSGLRVCFRRARRVARALPQPHHRAQPRMALRTAGRGAARLVAARHPLTAHARQFLLPARCKRKVTPSLRAPNSVAPFRQALLHQVVGQRGRRHHARLPVKAVMQGRAALRARACARARARCRGVWRRVPGADYRSATTAVRCTALCTGRRRSLRPGACARHCMGERLENRVHCIVNPCMQTLGRWRQRRGGKGKQRHNARGRAGNSAKGQQAGSCCRFTQYSAPFIWNRGPDPAPDPALLTRVESMRGVINGVQPVIGNIQRPGAHAHRPARVARPSGATKPVAAAAAFSGSSGDATSRPPAQKNRGGMPRRGRAVVGPVDGRASGGGGRAQGRAGAGGRAPRPRRPPAAKPWAPAPAAAAAPAAPPNELGCRHFGACSGCTLANGAARPPLAERAAAFFRSLGYAPAFEVTAGPLTGWRCR